MSASKEKVILAHLNKDAVNDPKAVDRMMKKVLGDLDRYYKMFVSSLKNTKDVQRAMYARDNFMDFADKHLSIKSEDIRLKKPDLAGTGRTTDS